MLQVQDQKEQVFEISCGCMLTHSIRKGDPCHTSTPHSWALKHSSPKRSLGCMSNHGLRGTLCSDTPGYPCLHSFKMVAKAKKSNPGYPGIMGHVLNHNLFCFVFLIIKSFFLCLLLASGFPACLPSHLLPLSAPTWLYGVLDWRPSPPHVPDPDGRWCRLPLGGPFAGTHPRTLLQDESL